MAQTRLKISARDVLQDLRNGLDEEGLMGKYQLSLRQLQRLFRKIILKGYATPQELAGRLCVTKSQVFEAFSEAKISTVEVELE